MRSRVRLPIALALTLVGCAGRPAPPPPAEPAPAPRSSPVRSAEPLAPAPRPEPPAPVLVEGPDWFPYQGFTLAERRGTALDASRVLDAPAGKYGKVTRDGEQFVLANDRRVDFWGATFAGEESLPEPERADELAEYCASLGFNLARLTLRSLSPETLRRLDAFSARLAARGIYLALELELEGALDEEQVQALEERATTLFTHRNPHTRKTYAEDPAVAFAVVSRSGEAMGATPREAFELEAQFRERLFQRIVKSGYRGLLGGHNARLDPNLELALNALGQVASTEISSLPALSSPKEQVLEAALRRAAGRPYVVAEGPIPELTFQADRLALMAAYAGLARFAVTDRFSGRAFSVGGECAPEGLGELRCQPTLLALLPALSRWVVRRDLRAAPTQAYVPLKTESLLELGALRPVLPHGLELVTHAGFSVDAVAPKGAPIEWFSRYVQGERATSVTGELFVDGGEGQLYVDAPRSQAIVGRGGARRAVSNLSVRLGSGPFAVFATSLDGQVLAKSTSILLSAVGRAAYRGMTVDPERGHVVSAGSLPVLLEPVTGEVELGGLVGDTASVSVYALNSAGQRVTEVPVVVGPGSVRFELRPEYRALNYEIAR